LFGEDIAINAGSFMYFLPMLVFMEHRNRLDEKALLGAWKVFAQEMINIHAGQGMDIYWHKGGHDSIGEDEYMQMCACKTGCLTRMAAKLAAVLSNASSEQVETLGRFAEAVGIAYQIQDDILSASGSEFQAGKGYGDDITEGKRTLIVIHALKNASEKDRKRLLEILGMHTRDKRIIGEALAIMKKYGSVGYAGGKATKLVKQAWEEAERVLPDSGAKNRLKALADFLVDRKI
jgi:geranylgeranyl pyrophosphate synthase